MLTLYAHPFSSYCQKVLIPLYESGQPFVYKVLGQDAEVAAEHARLWPLRRMPVLHDSANDRTVFEATCIVEYLDQFVGEATRMVPTDPQTALKVRMLDRCFDHYVMTPMQKIVLDHLRPRDQRDPYGVSEARVLLDQSYQWLEQALDAAPWAIGQRFTLADCAAAPSLFYADWVHPIPQERVRLRAYRSRLLARPAFARAIDEARPFRPYFPPGAPDRD